jgi:cobalamin 5'-phosphate synthase/cobalamin synthase
MRQLLGAVSFLTRIPVPQIVQTAAELGKTARWFPLVGLGLGGVYAGVCWLLAPRLPAMVVATLLLVVDALLTGALHIDGLADMADGFGGGRTREDVLRIMREHAIGSYGAAALILVFLLKTACLTTLIADGRSRWILCLAPALSRWSIVLMTQLSPYARKTADGSGAVSAHVGRAELAIASATCLALPFLFGPLRTVICWVAVATLTLLMTVLCRWRIGGFTGDTLGANVVTGEALQFVIALLAPRH